MVTTVAGFILRAVDRDKTARFYAELGLRATEHRHGGPLHHVVGPMSEECVMEVYLRSTTFSQDAVMLYVDSLDVALQIAAGFCVQPATDVKEVGNEKFVYIADPDGRPVMLIEKNEKACAANSAK
jgi:hypothetical protein